MSVSTNRTNDSIAFLLYGYAAELTIPPSAFKTLEKGCAALAIK